ncbi:MAG: peptidase C1, partial [bacterium]
ESAFGRGSETNATLRIWKQYGIVPAEAYGAIDRKTQFYDDNKMFLEMKNYLNSVKERSAWNEDDATSNVRAILNRHMGAPPTTVTVAGRTMTPQEYLRDIVRLNLDDYMDVMSLAEKPYYDKVEYEVWDNWWHSKDYYNVPVDDFMNVIKRAVREGYTLCISGDNSEPGFYPPLNVAMVPSFDIASQDIDDTARLWRFANESTTDDHAIHLVGYLEKDGKDWYLIKDSATKSRNGLHEGYTFYHEDFVRLKMMNIMLHKDIVAEAIAKFAVPK